jgi:hypothetical protein
LTYRTAAFLSGGWRTSHHRYSHVMSVGSGRIIASQAAMAEAIQCVSDALMQAGASGDEQGAAAAVAEFEQIREDAREPAYPTAVLSLITALLIQAEVSNSDNALNRALDLLDDHEETFRDDGWRLEYLAMRGRALLMKAQRSRDPVVMDKAVQVQRTARSWLLKDIHSTAYPFTTWA